MNKNTIDLIIKSQTAIDQKQYSKAISTLESILPLYSQMDLATLYKFSIQYSKVSNLHTKTKKFLKKSENLLKKTVSTFQESNKKVPDDLIYYTLLTAENLANIYNTKKRFLISLEYLKRAADLIKGKKYSGRVFEQLSKARINISSIYLELEKFMESLHHSNLALEAAENMIKLTYNAVSIHDAIHSNEKVSERTVLIFVLCYFNIAVAKNAINEKTSSEKNFLAALTLIKEINNNELISDLASKIKEKYKESINSTEISPVKLRKKSISFDSLKSNNFFQTSYSPEKLAKVRNSIISRSKFVSADEFFLKRL